MIMYSLKPRFQYRKYFIEFKSIICNNFRKYRTYFLEFNIIFCIMYIILSYYIGVGAFSLNPRKIKPLFSYPPDGFKGAKLSKNG